MTKAALDSAFAPSDAQIAAAKEAGYVAWFGYFKFGNDGIYNGWADSDFERVLAGGLQTSAYWSGYADPLQVKARAARLGIRARLDVEGGLRPDGPWVQGALDAAGSGLYGNWPVFAGRTALDSIVAAYPTAGDPGNESWPSWISRPASDVCGWQWAGSHAFAGITVDSTWLDDGFFAFSAAGGTLGGGVFMALTDAEQSEMLNTLRIIHQGLFEKDAFAGIKAADGSYVAIQDAVANTLTNVVAIKAAVDALKVGGSGLTTAQDAALSQLAADAQQLLAKTTSIEANLNAPRPPA